MEYLNDDCIGLIFEHCEHFGAIFLALCNKRFYNIAKYKRVDLRYRMNYLYMYHKLALNLIPKDVKYFDKLKL